MKDGTWILWQEVVFITICVIVWPDQIPECGTWFREVCVVVASRKQLICQCLLFCSLKLSEQNGHAAERSGHTRSFYIYVYYIIQTWNERNNLPSMVL
jgi:hypothetical protein